MGAANFGNFPYAICSLKPIERPLCVFPYPARTEPSQEDQMGPSAVEGALGRVKLWPAEKSYSVWGSPLNTKA